LQPSERERAKDATHSAAALMHAQPRRKSAPSLAPTPEMVATLDHIVQSHAALQPSPSSHSCSSLGTNATSSTAQLRFDLPLGSLHSSNRAGSRPRSRSITSKAESIFGMSNAGDSISVEGIESFSVLSLWEQRDVAKHSGSFLSTLDHQQASPLDEDDMELYAFSSFLVRRVVVAPNSRRRVLWDLLSLLCLVHDTTVIPMQFLTFPDTLFMNVLAWWARLFWTLDLGASLLTGFALSDGSQEVRPTKILKHFAKTWLVPDVLLVALDWMQLGAHSGGGILHVFQALRMLRLLRLARTGAMINAVLEHASSEKFAVVVSVTGSLIAIVCVSHVMACCWLGLGRMGGDGWVSLHGLEDHERWLQFAISFHWALCQFCGTMELHPTNLAERVYGICSLLLGFLLATAFVSSITSSLTRLCILTSQQASQRKVLRRYLREHGISRKLARRIQLNAQHMTAEQQRNTPECDVELLKVVSEPLRVDLHFEIYSQTLMVHPFFRCWAAENPASMRQLCHSAVSVISISQDDVLFSSGEVPVRPQMLFVRSGELRYYQGSGTGLQTVIAGEWACEHVLWTKWVYHGKLYAARDCRLTTVDARAFHQVALKSQASGDKLSRYASEFVKLLNVSPNMRSDLGSSTDTNSLSFLAFPCEPYSIAVSADSGARCFPRRFSNPQIVPIPSMRSASPSELS